MDTPSVIYYEHDFNDSVEKSLAKSVLNLGNECRALAEENARLKAEVASLKSLCDNLGMGGKHTITAIVEENKTLKAEVEMLKGRVNYWKIEAECDHGRWTRTLEDLERIRNLK